MSDNGICPGSGRPGEVGSRCPVCGTSFGFPHPANSVVGRPVPDHEDPDVYPGRSALTGEPCG